MSRKKNECSVTYLDGNLYFGCEASNFKDCGFSWFCGDGDECCDHMGDDSCECTDAQNDAMSRAAHAIQQEQLRRANADPEFLKRCESEIERSREFRAELEKKYGR